MNLNRAFKLKLFAFLSACAFLVAGVFETTAATKHFELHIGSERFLLELAADQASRSLGLAGRESIEPNGGMLFVFPIAEVRSFFMRDCVIPIDIVFLDSVGRITATYTMDPETRQADSESDTTYFHRLKRYSSLTPSRYAVELRAGTIDRLGLRRADRLALDKQELRYALR
jgi:hypothetical protein